MEENVKNQWLAKIKSGKVAVIESHYAPKNNTNCIWLKDGVMYVYGNSGWEVLSGGGSGGGGNLPVVLLASAKESEEQYSNLWFYGYTPELFTNNIHLNKNQPYSPSIYYTGIEQGTYIEVGDVDRFQSWYESASQDLKDLADDLTEKYGEVVQSLVTKSWTGDTGYVTGFVMQEPTSEMYTVVIMYNIWETVSNIISEGAVELSPYNPYH